MKLIKSCLLSLLIAFFCQNVKAESIRNRIAQRMVDKAYDSPTNLPAGAKLERDIAYGDDPAQRMDAYIPQNAKDAPVVFMVHGGGWRTGDKILGHIVDNKVKRWLPKGIVFVSINYRLLPDANPLVQAQDVAKALAKAQSLAPSWGANSKHFILMGHSSGAHLVALVNSRSELGMQNGIQPYLGSILLDNSVYDVEKVMKFLHLPLYQKAFGENANFWKSVSPIYQLKQKTPPILAVCSSQMRERLSCPQAEAFIAKAKNFGIQASVMSEALSHAEINDDLGLPSAYTESVEAFMHSLDLPNFSTTQSSASQ